MPQAELLDGQKLQGVLTSNEVQAVLRLRGWEVSLRNQGVGFKKGSWLRHPV